MTLGRKCQCCDSIFVVTEEDCSFYQTVKVPEPTWCPSCREMRRMTWCNEGILYLRDCDLCLKRTVSQYAPHNPRTTYCLHCWWSDKWNAQDYGREIDTNRSILDQIQELILDTPHCHTNTDTTNENSEYTHHAGREKNCYMVFHCSYAEDCYYGYGIKKAADCIDNHYCHESELCYECIDVYKCFDLAWCQDCNNCSSSRFLFDCVGCSNCVLCTGLRNSEYFFLNEKLTKAEYEAQTKELQLGSSSSVQALLRQFQRLKEEYGHRNLQMNMVEDSLGNHLYRARDCSHCFDCGDIEHSKYCSQVQLGTRHCHDIYQFGIGIELCYDCSMIGYSVYNCQFCHDLLEQCSNLQYCISCHSTKDSFGCYGLRGQQYCILNKQYSKEEYEKLLPELIGRMKVDREFGAFFPVEMSPHGYNETTAFHWYPKEASWVRKQGWFWEDKLPFSRGGATLTQIPDQIADITDSITGEVLACQACSRDYKLIPQELRFYRTNSYPLPRECFQCRRARRMSDRDPRQFWTRACSGCDAEMYTTISPDRSVQVYCEECHLKRIYA
ncbi:hypothetical protein OAO01_03080 [Oligoflexia bacterium]|nr:hypothetical protein [Oligoflexia bacterium]